MENNNNNKKLNIVLFPWLAFGHIIPFLDLSKHLALRGHHIFFVSTPRNLLRLPKIPENIASLITLVPLPLPQLENLPPNAEATSDVGFEIGTDLLKKAFDGLKQPMSEFLQTTSSLHPLDWIIYDFCCYWLPPIADKLSIRKVYFSIYFARTLSVFPTKQMDESSSSRWNDICTPPPWIPFTNSSVYFLPHESRNLMHTANQVTSSGVSDVFRFNSCVKGCDLILVRSCNELEAEYLQLVQHLNDKTVLPSGLLPPSLEDGLGEDEDAWKIISSWLEKQNKGSVVYIAFGSEFEPSQDQLSELALGLEISELPFFWAFRKSSVSSLELPKGFEDRTQGRGMVWTSWAPQLKILSHESIGGFVTHCGWSSIIEALQFGKPLIMLPLAIDHGLFARFMSQDKRVGIEIPRNGDGSITRSSVAESLKLVISDEAGKIYRDEAQKLSAIFGDKSLHERYIDKFNAYLCNIV